MLIDAMSFAADLTTAAELAAQCEAEGYDAIWTGETTHDPFLACLLGAQATRHVTVGTAVAIAFARSPMTVANSAYDLAQLSGGRFVLGLGTQVKPHVTKRFSMPWSDPAARMREFVLALRAIWATWHDGAALEFRGEYYTHTLMTPFFAPPRHEYGPPPVFVAGVGSLLTRVAGEVCDGFHFHPFTTADYLRDVTVPALLDGRRRGGADSLDGFTIAGPAFACVGRDEDELATAIAGTKQQIAFYASTEAYRGVLDHHGWGDLQPELARLAKQGRWSEMKDAIDDEVLRAFAPVGDVATVAAELHQRWATATRISLYTTYDVSPSLRAELLAALRSHR
jgi:probable F420-dependent oxidoreductase